MRAVIIAVFIILLAPFSGLVVAEKENQEENTEQEENLIIPTYSIAVQLAFDRVENLEQYTDEELRK